MKGNIHFLIQSYIQLAKICDVNDMDKRNGYMKKAEELLELSSTQSQNSITEYDLYDYNEYQRTKIQEFLQDKERTCVLQCWCQALGNKGKPTRMDSNEIVRILESIGWERGYIGVFGAYGNQHIWKK